MPMEIKRTSSKEFYLRCAWERRAETTDSLASRFLRTIDSFRRIDPVFDLWECGRKRTKKLESNRNCFAEEIAEGISRDDWGEPDPVYGYRFSAWTRDVPKDCMFVFRCHGGATVASLFPNDAILETYSPKESGPNPHVVSYKVFRTALLALVEAWEPVKAGAYSRKLIQMNDEGSYFPRPWIQYLCPWLAQKIAPPATALVERLPDGGLLMSAATETFDVNNPQHMAVASDIAAAMAPLDRLPWPSQQ
jgi:hypothetical protein